MSRERAVTYVTVAQYLSEAYTGTHYRRLAFDARMRQKIKTAFVTPASGGNIRFDSWQLPFISVRRIHL